ncbi:MAG TPA: AMIN domain-containing protein, partial [Geobacteraceae bacterium]|nr:AMIN domain-containing protein [Geobacteraceae bacterium]
MRPVCRALLFCICLALMVALVPWLSAAEEKEPGQKTAARKHAVKKAKQAKKSKKKKTAKKSSGKTAGAKPNKQATGAAVEKSGNQTTAAALVKEMRHWSNPDYTRIAVSLDREAAFESHQLPQLPGSTAVPRIYIDIDSARVAAGVKDIAIGDGLLKTARIGQYKPDTVRVVLDM